MGTYCACLGTISSKLFFRLLKPPEMAIFAEISASSMCACVCTYLFRGVIRLAPVVWTPKSMSIALGVYCASLIMFFLDLVFGPLKRSKIGVFWKFQNRKCVPVCAHTCSGVRGARSESSFPQSISEKKTGSLTQI